MKLTKKLSVTPCVPGKIFLGPPRLYQELEELQHDLAVVEEVSLLVGTLHGIYQVTTLLHRRYLFQSECTDCNHITLNNLNHASLGFCCFLFSAAGSLKSHSSQISALYTCFQIFFIIICIL